MLVIVSIQRVIKRCEVRQFVLEQFAVNTVCVQYEQYDSI